MALARDRAALGGSPAVRTQTHEERSRGRDRTGDSRKATRPRAENVSAIAAKTETQYMALERECPTARRALNVYKLRLRVM